MSKSRSSVDKHIRKWDDPVLKVKCEPVQPGEALPFLDLMERVCTRAPGAGLAAPQVGVAKRVIFVNADPGRGIKARFMINPEITGHLPDTEVAEEGCLSYPGIVRKIPRHKDILVRYLDLRRVAREERITGYEARVVQHEIDHLDGICKVGDSEYPQAKVRPDALRSAAARVPVSGATAAE